MNKFLVALSLLATFSNAEEHFEINKKNCNLPISEIRKLVPEKNKQEQIKLKCAEKASSNNWMKKTLLPN